MLPVSIFVTCVDPGATTYTARFGTNNVNPTAVTIPIGRRQPLRPCAGEPGPGDAVRHRHDTDAVTVTGHPERHEPRLAAERSHVDGELVVPDALHRGSTRSPRRPAVRISGRCVVNGATTYEARFGYTNENSTTVSIPVGESNRFVPTPAGRGQTTLFAPGASSQAFAVTGIPNGTNLVWLVSHAGDTTTSTASATSGRSAAGRYRPSRPSAGPAGSTRFSRPTRIPARPTSRSGSSSTACSREATRTMRSSGTRTTTR